MESGYKKTEGLRIYESAIARPYQKYARFALQKLIRKFGVPAGTCLDLACGAGHLVRFLTDGGWDAYGCDVSPDMVETAQNNYPDLSSRFFVADMCAIPRTRKYDLVTVVFNSIHYLPPESRSSLWTSLGAVLKPGGFFVSQQNTVQAMTKYWLHQTHRWESDDGCSFWSGLPGPSPESILVEKQYFERTAASNYRLSQAQHVYYFFTEAEMRDGLLSNGVEIAATRDGRTLGPPTPSSESVWVIARKHK